MLLTNPQKPARNLKHEQKCLQGDSTEVQGWVKNNSDSSNNLMGWNSYCLTI